MCDGGIGGEQGRVVDAGELFAYHVEGDQNGAVHDDLVGDVVQWWLRYKRRKKRRKTKHFGYGEKDNE